MKWSELREQVGFESVTVTVKKRASTQRTWRGELKGEDNPTWLSVLGCLLTGDKQTAQEYAYWLITGRFIDDDDYEFELVPAPPISINRERANEHIRELRRVADETGRPYLEILEENTYVPKGARDSQKLKTEGL